MIKKILNIILIVAVLIFSGCTSENVDLVSKDNSTLMVKLLSFRAVNDNNTDTAINHVVAYRFEDHILKEVITDLIPDVENKFVLKPSAMAGKIYFMVNASQVLDNQSFIVGETSEQEFLSMKSNIENMSSSGLLMTGEAEISSITSELTVALKRSMARIDLESTFTGVQVNSVKVKGIVPEGYVFANENRLENTSGTVDLSKDFGETPFQNAKSPLFYLPEQSKTGFQVEVMISVNDSWHKLKTVLPQIKRNTIYTIKVYGKGADFKLEVKTDEWEQGEGTTSNGIVKGMVDLDNSFLSDGVTVNETGDTVFVDSWENNFSLSLLGEEGSEINIRGKADGVDIQLSSSRTLLPVSQKVEVSSNRKLLGSIDQYIYLDIYKNAVLQGRVVIVFQANPVKVDGRITFDENGICDFQKYVEGELGLITLPEGKEVRLAVPQGESNWMKLERNGNRVFRLLGGWKPNDPHADGREQIAYLIISNTGNTQEEVYTIKRQNWGLPVVDINGTWWCKYNLRGNVKNFKDQILIGHEPCGDKPLLEYLANCSDEEFLSVMGDQYHAGNYEGLKLTYNETGFRYEGYTGKADNIGTIDPTTMAPDGYEIPDYNDFRFFSWGNNSNLAYFYPGYFDNKLGQRLKFWVVERDAVFLGNEYGTINFYDFEYNDQHLVLCGLGHQWSATSVSKMSVLFATYGHSINTWSIDGSSKASGKGNWIKYVAHNIGKTRTIRCIKTPVEYIYD